MIQSAETRLDGNTLVVRIPMRFRPRGGHARTVDSRCWRRTPSFRLSEMVEGGSFEQEEAPWRLVETAQPRPSLGCEMGLFNARGAPAASCSCGNGVSSGAVSRRARATAPTASGGA
jgi:hypothetical protein